MDETKARVKALRKMTGGNQVQALAKDLELSAVTDEPDEETSKLDLNAHSFASSLSIRERNLLRMVVRKVHLRHLPGDMITDLEADRVIDAMGPITQEKLVKKAVDHGLGS